MLKMVRDIRIRRLGAGHRLTINVQYDIAVNYRICGKFQKSLKLIQDVVQSRKESLGADHPDYLCAKHQEAVTLFRRGKWKEALQEQKRTLKAQEFLLGKTHPDTVLSKYTLAGIYLSLRHNLEEANDLILEVIHEQTGRYGENHPIVLRSRARYVLILLERGPKFFKQAKKEQEIIVKRREEHYSRNHSMVRNARNDLAQIIQASRNDTDLQEALEIYNDLIGTLPEHSVGLQGFEIRSNQGSCLFELRKYKEAERIQRDIYNKLKKELESNEDPRDDSARFVAATFNLALTVRHLDSESERERLTKACELLTEAVTCAEDFFGRDHPQSVGLRTTLCEWQREEENLKMGHPHTDPLQDSVVSLAPRSENRA
jgi:hypothetical protein